MAKTARKAELQVPRKRVIAKAPPAPKKPQNLSIEFSAVLLLVIAFFLTAALCSQLSNFGPPAELRDETQLSRSNLMGQVGALISSYLLRYLGYCSFIIIAWALLLARSICAGWKPNIENSLLAFSLRSVASAAMLLAAAIASSVLFGFSGGGALGTKGALFLIRYLNEAGALLVAGTIFFLALGISTGFGVLSLVRGIRSLMSLLFPVVQDSGHVITSGAKLMGGFVRSKGKRGELAEGGIERPFTLDEDVRPVRKDYKRSAVEKVSEPEMREGKVKKPEKLRILRKSAEEREKESKKGRETPKQNKQEFRLPNASLLVRGESGARTAPKDQELIENSRRLEKSLENFRIGGQVVEVQPGPVITLYQFEPAPGVKVQKIVSLADDLALALKVASVRVYAPVPGKGTVGIEVPNAHREIVRLRDLIETKEFHDQQHQIALALGKDTFGEPFISDLAKMPHLLIAGATGTGKSVCINSILLSLLYRNTPDDLRLIMIDPKMLELSIYEDIPHLKAPVVTLAKRARGVLWWAAEEMERRYALMKDVGVRNLASFNSLVISEQAKGRKLGKKERNKIIELYEKDVVSTSSEQPALSRDGDDAPLSSSGKKVARAELEPLPRIVIVVDELADLMLTVGREVEELLTRLAQKARAAGIHLILATQRPSVNVITGLIKANFPSRISFKVASRIDARTVLDTSGAEKLLGQGDMLFLSPGAGRPRRLHSPFVSDKEVHDVVDFLRSQGRPEYDAQIESMIERLEQQETQGTPGDGSPEEYDALYDQALNYVLEKGAASTSMIQRIFRIGYNRAARILETMEREGVVGPADGAKPRQVLLPSTRDDI